MCVTPKSVSASDLPSLFCRKRKEPDDHFSDVLQDIMTKLTEWRQDLKQDIQALSVNYTNISVAVQTIQSKQEHEFSELKRTLEFTINKQSDLEARIVPLEAIMSANKSLESDVSTLQSTVRDLSCQLKEQQQWDRMLNLEIAGVPELKNENLVDIATKISKHAGVDLNPEDIVHISRVQSRSNKAGRPKVMVMKLRKRLLKDNILAGLRKQRGVSTADIGIPGSSQRVFVNEHLTVENKLLYKNCREAAQAKQYQYVWVKNCKIFMRKTDSSPFVHVRDESFLTKLR